MATVAYLTVTALLITAVASDTTKYTNHTVGGAAGWFFNTTANAASTNYSSWAATQTFNLGDYLIFNTDSNQTVIETYNETIYHSCHVDPFDDSTFQHGVDGGGNQTAETIAVELVIEGPGYYFSDAGAGSQCHQGMAFSIVVNQGLGFPSDLVQAPTPSQSDSPPDTAAGDQSSGGGTLRTGANLHWVVSVLLFGGALLVLR